jgi:hypothetical protein
MAVDDRDSAERIARIEQMIAEYRHEKERKLMRRAMRLWRRAEADQRCVDLERLAARVH